jgi:electron-transferring-flavoprotein dehydrogenase
MQRWKTHPAIRAHIEGGKRIGYGARAINNGTPQALPKTVFPGGALVGCDAGYLNAARIKGSHAAIKSGMLCAEAMAATRCRGPRASDELTAYPEAFEQELAARGVAADAQLQALVQEGPPVGH